MKVLILLAFLACAAGAPQFYHHHHHHHPPPPPPPPHRDENFSLEEYFKDDIFDTGRFWSQLSRELMDMDRMLQDFNRHFQSNVNSEKIDGNFYKITIPISGFDEADFKVKARDGVLMIQAVHTSDEHFRQKNYLDMRTLPSFIDVKGFWTYENEVLSITFPLKETPTTEAPSESTTFTEVGTAIPDIIMNAPENHSKEEMEPQGNDETGDADIGVLGKTDSEVETNAIDGNDRIEATTYAVDLKDEYEFVPIRY